MKKYWTVEREFYYGKEAWYEVVYTTFRREDMLKAVDLLSDAIPVGIPVEEVKALLAEAMLPTTN
jgi:hypothetical protein